MNVRTSRRCIGSGVRDDTKDSGKLSGRDGEFGGRVVRELVSSETDTTWRTSTLRNWRRVRQGRRIRRELMEHTNRLKTCSKLKVKFMD